jgi:hypothetical protein
VIGLLIVHPLEGIVFTDLSGARDGGPRVDGLGGDDYIRHLLLPNFCFHISIAHAILRHLGAKIGKRDYLDNLTQQSGGDYS